MRYSVKDAVQMLVPKTEKQEQETRKDGGKRGVVCVLGVNYLCVCEHWFLGEEELRVIC